MLSSSLIKGFDKNAEPFFSLSMEKTKESKKGKRDLNLNFD